MKAEQRKEIETNSLVLAVQRARQRLTGRNLYYVAGVAAIVVGGLLLYRYLTTTSTKARDAVLLQLASADTPEKLRAGMEEHRGTIYGSWFKMNLARHELLNEGLPKLGTASGEQRKRVAASLEQARTYFRELTGEFKQQDDPALLQEAWYGAAQAEEALVGMPTADGGNDSRGNVDKAIEYYEKAAAILPDSEPSKRYKAWAEKLSANKVQFVATQKALYAERPAPPSAFGPPGKDPFDSPFGAGDPFGKDSPFGAGAPPRSGTEPPVVVPPPPTPKIEAPGDPKADTPTTPKADAPAPPKADAPKIEVPPLPPVPPAPGPKTPEPRPVDPPKTDPKAK